jgi:hypothetical protein
LLGLAVTPPIGSRCEISRDGGGDLQELEPRRRSHFVGHVNDATGSQMGVEGHLDNGLSVIDELASQQ